MLSGDDSYKAAQKQKNISAETLIDMLIIIGKHLQEKGEHKKALSQFEIALKIIDVFSEDYLENKFFNATIYEYTREQRKEIEQLLVR